MKKEQIFRKSQFDKWQELQALKNKIVTSVFELFQEYSIQGITYLDNFKDIINTPYDAVWKCYDVLIEEQSKGIDFVRHQLEPQFKERLKSFEWQVKSLVQRKEDWIYNRAQYNNVRFDLSLLSIENTVFDEKSGKFVTNPKVIEDMKSYFTVEVDSLQKTVKEKLINLHDAINDLAKYLPMGHFYHDLSGFKDAVLQYDEKDKKYSPDEDFLFEVMDVAVKPT